MNKKIKRAFELNLRFYLILMLLFAAATFFCGKIYIQLAGIELLIVVILFIYSRLSVKKKRRDIENYIESVTDTAGTVAGDTLHNFPLPMAVFSLDSTILVSANEDFMRITGLKERLFETRMSDAVPSFSTKWLMEGKSECPENVEIGGSTYKVYGNIIRADSAPGVRNYVASTYWIDITDYARIKTEFEMTRPVFSIIMLDNYDEFFRSLTDKDKSAILSMIDDKISAWAGSCNGYLSKYDRDRYIFIFEEQYLQGFIDGKFSLLDDVHSIMNTKSLHATLSIGVGRDGKTLQESFQFASLSLDMALSRGGDQAVIKNKFNFEFFGGRSSEVEKRTKVKSRVMANSLSDLMSESSGVFIMGHSYADFDTIGSAVGLCCAARKKETPAYIVVDMDKNSSRPLIDRMMTLPEYKNVFISPQEAILQANGSSLLIIVDTNRPEQVESEALLLSCNHIAIIDHHRRAATYIQNAALNFHEPYASSASELVTELLQYIVEQSDILRYEAEALLCGIVLDTKNFTLRTGGRTFDAAAFLRRVGADTTQVKRLLQSDINTAMARYAIIQKAKVYKAGIAIAAPESAESRVIAAQAADELLNISGIQASFVVFPENGSISISARSIGDINVQVIVEKLGGGGNKSTAGAQITGKTQKDVVTDLLKVIDTYLEDSKS